LRYWFSIELFSPLPLPKKGSEVIEAENDHDIWWLQPESESDPNNQNKNQRHRHRVFVGRFTQTDLSQAVIRYFSNRKISETERIALDNRQDAEFCLFSFDVDDSGIPLGESFFLSSAAWALANMPSQPQEYQKIPELFDQATEQSKHQFHAWAKQFQNGKRSIANSKKHRTYRPPCFAGDRRDP